jgi:plasmid stabilization system protein ParE
MTTTNLESKGEHLGGSSEIEKLTEQARDYHKQIAEGNDALLEAQKLGRAVKVDALNEELESLRDKEREILQTISEFKDRHSK